MMPQYKFLSPAWLVEVERIIRSRITPETIRYSTTSVLTVFEDCPDGGEKALYFETAKGVVNQVSVKVKPYPKADFTVSGAYRDFMKVFRGQLEPAAAVMTGELKFQGNMLKALGMISVLEPFYKGLGEIPTDFE